MRELATSVFTDDCRDYLNRCTECSKSERVSFLLPDRTMDQKYVWTCQGCQEEVPDKTIETFLLELEDKSIKLGYSANTGT